MGSARTWTQTQTSTTSTLHDVVSDAHTYVVGSGGLLLERRDGSYGSLLETGVAGNSRDLRGVATTDDGRRVWVAGASGALGYYDVVNREMVDRSHPDSYTVTFRDVTVSGAAGEERVVAVDGSGQVFDLSVEGTATALESITKPGDGSAFDAVCDAPDGTIYAADTVGYLYRAEDGQTFERRQVANEPLVGVAVGEKRVETVTASGTFVEYRFDESAKKLYEVGADDPQDLTDDGTPVVVGEEGHVYEWTEDDSLDPFGVDVGSMLGVPPKKPTFTRAHTSVGVTLNAVDGGQSAVAVGEMGIIVESA